MKYGKYVILGIASFLTMSTPVYAIGNPLSDNQEKNEKELQNKAKENDITYKASDNQKISISDESYSLYASSKESFNQMQTQYGSLDEDSNMGKGFSSYLSSIREDKENQQFQAKLNQMAQGYYSVDVSTDNYEALANALAVTDETKKETIENQEKESEEKKDSILEDTDDDYDSNLEFGAGFNKNLKDYTDKYNEKVSENQKNTEETVANQQKEFGEDVNKSSDAAKKDLEDVNEQSKKNKLDIQNSFSEEFTSQSQKNNSELENKKNVAESFLNSGENKTIVKNYSTLRKAIITAQKTIANASKSATATKEYANKVKSIIAKA